MLTNEELKEYLQEIVEYMKKPDAQNSKISVYLKNLSNTFYSLLTVKENGNFAMIQAVTIQFQMTLQQMPQDIKSEVKQKLRELLLNFSRDLGVIAENLENLESGNMEIYKATSNLYLYINQFFKLKELTVTYPRPGPFHM
ncbi:MAG: hypothetical protein ACFFDN_44345 [Candidatus Hodarchaeota archaeon]